MTSVLGPIPKNPLQTGKCFQELSEFVDHKQGMFMVEQLRLRLGELFLKAHVACPLPGQHLTPVSIT